MHLSSQSSFLVLIAAISLLIVPECQGVSSTALYRDKNHSYNSDQMSHLNNIPLGSPKQVIVQRGNSHQIFKRKKLSFQKDELLGEPLNPGDFRNAKTLCKL